MNQPRLLVQGRGNWVYTHPIGDRDETAVGRGPENDIDVNDLHASAQHAIIERKGNGYVIRDLISRNGTLLNGKKIEAESPLAHGDKIRIGMTEMTFLTDADDVFTGPRSDSPPAGKSGGSVKDEPPEISPEALAEEPFKPGQSAEEIEKELRKARETIRVLKITTEFVRLLAGKASPSQIVSTALKLMAKLARAENGFIMQIDPATKKWSVRSRYGDILDWTGVGEESGDVQLPMSLTVVEQVIRTGEPVASPYTLQDPRFNAAHSVATLGIHSCLCFPMVYKGEPSGVAYVDRRFSPEPFSRWEQTLFGALTEQLNKLLYP